MVAVVVVVVVYLGRYTCTARMRFESVSLAMDDSTEDTAGVTERPPLFDDIVQAEFGRSVGRSECIVYG